MGTRIHGINLTIVDLLTFHLPLMNSDQDHDIFSSTQRLISQLLRKIKGCQLIVRLTYQLIRNVLRVL